jgi:hypothetical protein
MVFALLLVYFQLDACCSPAVQIDVTEYMFKLALLQRKYDQVINMIRSSTLCGSAIIRYRQLFLRCRNLQAATCMQQQHM